MIIACTVHGVRVTAPWQILVDNTGLSRWAAGIVRAARLRFAEVGLMAPSVAGFTAGD